jgi:phospholipid/cholesterol/gamma-HCH transport system substrate-binding protein
MQRNPLRDLLVGLFVLAGFAAIAYLSLSVGGFNYEGPGGLRLHAKFDEISGLKLRAPVVIAGVKVGQVTGISLDESHRARTDMEVDATLALPADTTASIVTAGLLGDRYINLKPGGEDQMLKDGEEVAFTESAVVLENLIGKFIYGGSDSKKAEGEATPAAEGKAAE